MTGRGFLKSRLASLKAQEPEQLKAEELPKLATQPVNGNASVQPVVRGRRVIIVIFKLISINYLKSVTFI